VLLEVSCNILSNFLDHRLANIISLLQENIWLGVMDTLFVFLLLLLQR
jgi:hypothetical protein